MDTTLPSAAALTKGSERGFWHSPTGLFVGFLAVLATTLLDAVIAPLGIPLALLVIWILLRAAKESWGTLGLRKPSGWLQTVGWAVVGAAGMQAFAVFVLIPGLKAAGAPPPDLSVFAVLEGNVQMLLVMLVVSWTTAGFGEEIICRGFLMGRLARIFGEGRGAWIAALLVISTLFGLLHAYQGVTGIVLTGFAGLFLGTLYLASGRNLWLPILTHALIDTSSFIALYLGWGDRLLG